MIDSNADERLKDERSRLGFPRRPIPTKRIKPNSTSAPKPGQDDTHACAGNCGSNTEKEEFGLPQFTASISDYGAAFGKSAPSPLPLTKAQQDAKWIMAAWNAGPSKS